MIPPRTIFGVISGAAPICCMTNVIKRMAREFFRALAAGGLFELAKFAVPLLVERLLVVGRLLVE